MKTFPLALMLHNRELHWLVEQLQHCVPALRVPLIRLRSWCDVPGLQVSLPWGHEGDDFVW
jgi:hypothetical protein